LTPGRLNVRVSSAFATEVVEPEFTFVIPPLGRRALALLGDLVIRCSGVRYIIHVNHVQTSLITPILAFDPLAENGRVG
jgi:hypothetical protein